MAEDADRRGGPPRPGGQRRRTGGSGRGADPAAGRGGRRPTASGARDASASRRPPRSDAARPARPSGPPLPEGVDWLQLDPDSRRDLRSLPKELAERVGAHLVAAGQLLADDPAAARAHARRHAGSPAGWPWCGRLPGSPPTPTASGPRRWPSCAPTGG